MLKLLRIPIIVSGMLILHAPLSILAESFTTNSPTEIESILKSAKPGDKILIEVNRSGGKNKVMISREEERVTQGLVNYQGEDA